MTKTICEFLGAWVLLSIVVSLFLGRALKSGRERDTLSLDTTEREELVELQLRDPTNKEGRWRATPSLDTTEEGEGDS